MNAVLKSVMTSELLFYPFDLDLRLESHHFFTAFHDRWLNSEFRLCAKPDARGIAWDLYCIAQRQTPVGTIPVSDLQLARLTLLSVDDWREMAARDYGPLYGWVRCQCGDEVRLAHPVLLECIESAVGQRQRKREEAERGRETKRIERLPEQMRRAGASQRQLQDYDLIRRLDAWLLRNCPTNRTIEWVRRAMEVDATRDAVIG